MGTHTSDEVLPNSLTHFQAKSIHENNAQAPRKTLDVALPTSGSVNSSATGVSVVYISNIPKLQCVDLFLQATNTSIGNGGPAPSPVSKVEKADLRKPLVDAMTQTEAGVPGKDICVGSPATKAPLVSFLFIC